MVMKYADNIVKVKQRLLLEDVLQSVDQNWVHIFSAHNGASNI